MLPDKKFCHYQEVLGEPPSAGWHDWESEALECAKKRLEEGIVVEAQ